ncbi:MAG: pknB 24 [Gemmataceae bacterium]|nr:pknB 24 [Gemmataceae bacterium]
MSSAADPTATFLTSLRTTSLLTPAQVEDVAGWAARVRPDVPALAKEIHRRGWLTVYQIKEIARGRGKELVLGDYVLLDLLGEGGMGRVFKAHNSRLGRDEALKVIRADKVKHPAAEARFKQETEALGQVKHPNVVTAFDAGLIGATHFVSMELIDGTDLTRIVLDRGPLPLPEACEAIRQTALGLHHAFELGMVHRDIKPSNILVSRDGRQVKLVDLGLARLQEPVGEGGNRVTQEGFVIGTPDFLAPEQARNPGAVDIRADLYALGATLYYVLTAKVPYDGANATEKLLKHYTDPPPALRPHRPDAPPQVEQIIHWCMAKRPEDRPQTPLQLALALQPFCPPTGAGAGPAGGAFVPPGGYMPGTPIAPGAYPPGVPTPTAYGYPAPPGYPPAPAADPNPSSQTFKLPAQTNDADPIRRRAEHRFPVGLLLVGIGGLLLLGIFAYAAYRTFLGGRTPPVEPFTNTVGMKMVKIDGGTFRMGSPPAEVGRGSDDEGPAHEVTIRGPFLMSATEVTHTQYMRIMGAAPPQSVVIKRAANPTEHPVESVSYEEALDFCRRLTEKERDQTYAQPKWAYRLPTEAEWEYACRAGTDTPFSTGSTLINLKQALYTPTGDDKEITLEGGSTPGTGIEGMPGRVARFDPPNRWGLYDMHGNVAEWCLDWYKPGYPGDGPRDHPLGPATGSRRVVRGGSYKDPASACRAAARAFASPGDRKETIGFRVVYAPVLK